ncbi:unnamed protein product [Rhizopus microsporus]
MSLKTPLENITVTRSVSFDVYNNGAIRAKLSVQQAGPVYLYVSFNSGLMLRLLEKAVECGVLPVSGKELNIRSSSNAPEELMKEQYTAAICDKTLLT